MKEFIKEQERSKKYGCNGKCYGPPRICQHIDICPESRVGEFIGTVGAMITLVFFPVAVVVAIILMIKGGL